MEKRRYKLVAGLLALFFLVLVAAIFSGKIGQAMGLTGTDKGDSGGECLSCHRMDPEILTWQLSSHSQIACTECHDRQASDYKPGGARSDTSKLPVKPEAISNQVCEKCHSANRTMSPSGDLVIPHDRHKQAGVQCVTCHSGVVHAKIAERGLTAGGQNSPAVWDESLARQVTIKVFQQPSMWTCINCHKQAGVTRRCSACHTKINMLPSHDLPDWKVKHGQTARTNIGDCSKCHVTPDAAGNREPVPAFDAKTFARTQEFCYNCHLTRPESHGESMIPQHPKLAAEKGFENCLTCHEWEKPKPGDHVPGTYCSQCHWSPPKTE